MSFKSHDINLYLRQSLFSSLINYLIHCSDLMLSEYLTKNEKLKNNENLIRNCLVEEYLNIDKNKIANHIKALFESEGAENYNVQTKTYKGRSDIKVNTEDTFNDSNDYYIIECKRIDGTNYLNKEYITEGVVRFLEEKYSSYNNRNIMFGFIVDDIDIKENAKKIEEMQNKSRQVKNYIQSNFSIERENDNIHVLYSSRYITSKKNSLELKHLFYNFSPIIDNSLPAYFIPIDIPHLF